MRPANEIDLFVSPYKIVTSVMISFSAKVRMLLLKLALTDKLCEACYCHAVSAERAAPAWQTGQPVRKGRSSNEIVAMERRDRPV